MNKHVIITGASRGIGEAAARRFAKAGYDLTLVCRKNMDLLKALSTEFTESCGVTVRSFQGNAGEESFVSDLFSEIPEPDVLINNAGISYLGLLTEMSLSEWEEVLRSNLTSVFLFSKYAARSMVQRRAGHIINVSSVWGSVGSSCEVAYSASKGAVEAFTKALAKELAPSLVRVNAIAPGCIDTDMNRGFTVEERRDLEEEIPMGRFGTPEEAAELLLSLAESPAYLTGQIIGLTGGWIR